MRTPLSLVLLFCFPPAAMASEVDGAFTADPGQIPSASVTLADLRPDESSTTKFDLLNATDHVLTWTQASLSCGCQKITPESGSLKVGERMEFQVTVSSNIRQTTSLRNDLIVLLRADNTPVARIRTSQSMPLHSNFATSLVYVTRTKNEKSVELSIPINLGNRVSVDDCEFELGGLPGVTLHAKVSSDRKRLVGKLDFVAPMRVKSRGKLTLSCLSTGVLDEIPLLIEMSSELSVAPKSIRLTASSAEPSFVGTFFVRDNSLVNSGETELAKLTPTLRLGGKVYRGNAKSLRRGFWKVTLSIPRNEVNELREGSNDQRLWGPTRGSVSVRTAEKSSTEEVSIFFPDS